MPDDGLGPTWKLWRRRRYIVAFLAFLGFFNTYATRTNLSVAIVAMTNGKHTTLANGTEITLAGEFDWDSQTQGMLLSSFFYGYIVTQIPSALLAARIGGNKVFGAGIAMAAICSLITPPLTSINLYLLLVMRVFKGLFQGVTFPCMYAVWSKWAPPLERSRLAMIAFSGNYVGTVAIMTASGVLANHLGWQSIFYISGGVALVWYVAWWIVVKEGPDKDPHITPQELKYIQDSLDYDSTKEVLHPPWKKIFASFPAWAIIVAHFCSSWGFYTLLTHLPTFLTDFLHFSIEEIGFMSALPFAFMAFSLPIGGFIADFLRTKGLLSTTQVRKIFCCGCFIIEAILLLIIPLWGNPGFTIAGLIITLGAAGISWSGFKYLKYTNYAATGCNIDGNTKEEKLFRFPMKCRKNIEDLHRSVNHLDIAPQYGSILMALSNAFATIAGMISPIITGYIVRNKRPSEWQYVFYISSIIYVIGAVFFGIFASGEIQSWARHDTAPVSEKSTTLPVSEKSITSIVAEEPVISDDTYITT